jgi:hypothetical protein
MSFSDCTHSIIAADQTSPRKSDMPDTTALRVLVDAYDKPDANQTLKECIEIIIANLTFTFTTHPSLVGHGVLDKLNAQVVSKREPGAVQLPIALAFINFALNPENVTLLEEDFLLAVVLAKEVKGVSDSIKLRLLQACGTYINFVNDNMSHFNTSLFALLEDYIMHIFLLENRSEDLIHTVISILLHIINSIPQVLLLPLPLPTRRASCSFSWR